MVEHSRLVQSACRTEQGHNVTTYRSRGNSVVLAVSFVDSSAGHYQSTFTACTQSNVSSYYTAEDNRGTTCIQNRTAGRQVQTVASSDSDDLTSFHSGVSRETSNSKALLHGVFSCNVGHSRVACQRTSAIRSSAGSVACQSACSQGAKTTEVGTDLSLFPCRFDQLVSQKCGLSRSQGSSNEGVYNVVFLAVHRYAYAVHEGSSASDIRPSIDCSAGVAILQVGVLDHVARPVKFQIGNQTGSHRSEDFIKLIQFQSFLNVRPLSCYSEVVLNHTRCLTSDNVRLRGSRNITTRSTNAAVVSGALEIHDGASRRIELVGQKLGVNRLRQDSCRFELVKKDSGDFSGNVTTKIIGHCTNSYSKVAPDGPLGFGLTPELRG